MSGALLDALAGEVTALAFCWKLVRGDGVVLGFTSHDRAVRQGGICFEARAGMTPSAICTRAGFEPDSMAVSGVLAAAAVSAADLDLGRWDGALVELFCCDWQAPELGSLLLMRGYVGDVTRAVTDDRDCGAYSVELLSEMVKLVRGGPPRCSPTCRAELGDARCGVDMAGRTVLARVASVEADRLILAEAIAEPEAYHDGRLRILDGPFAGMDRRIATITGARELALEEVLGAADVADERVALTQGCDKRFQTCVERFGNAVAFAGEPHLPGTDALVRYGEG